MSDRKMDTVSRRDVLRATGSMLPAALIVPRFVAGDDPIKMPMRMLGRTNEQISAFTLGTGHCRTSLGLGAKEVGEIIERTIELGVNSIDTAPNYADAEELLGQVLKPHRDKIFLATKTESPTKEAAWEQLRESLKKLQTDHIDLVYIHNYGLESRFPDARQPLSSDGTIGALHEAKKQGLIRFIGVSGHVYPARFKHVLERDDIDVIMNTVNFVEKHIYDFEKKVFEPARRKNIGLIAMKVIGGPANWRRGTPRLTGENYDLAIRYGMGLPGVASMNIGVRSIEELEQGIRAVAAYKPLSDKENAELEKKGKELAQEWGAVYGEPVA